MPREGGEPSRFLATIPALYIPPESGDFSAGPPQLAIFSISSPKDYLPSVSIFFFSSSFIF
jgi:hypothetical protein